MPVVSMSAFEGKADILDAPCKCPLMTQSGHSELLVQNPVFAAMAAGMKKAKARWSQQVTEHSDALDLEKKEPDAKFDSPVTELRTNNPFGLNLIAERRALRGHCAQAFGRCRAYGTKLANLEFHSQIRSID